LEWRYKIEHTCNHGAKFRSSWPTELEDLTVKKK